MSYTAFCGRTSASALPVTSFFLDVWFGEDATARESRHVLLHWILVATDRALVVARLDGILFKDVLCALHAVCTVHLHLLHLSVGAAPHAHPLLAVGDVICDELAHVAVELVDPVHQMPSFLRPHGQTQWVPSHTCVVVLRHP